MKNHSLAALTRCRLHLSKPAPSLQVRLTDTSGNHFCGGALLRPRVVVTAAHCIRSDDTTSLPEEVKVVLGDHAASQDDGTEQKLDVARIIYHQKYDEYTVEHDIALLILSDEAKLNEAVQEIALAEDKTLYEEGAPITVIGWGGTQDGYESDVLQKFEYEVSNREACNKYYTETDNAQIYDGMLCTGKPPLTGHAWNGDSGGPLVAKVEDRFVLVALTSWGVGEPDVNSYDVNVDLFYYMSWIRENMAKSEQGKWVELAGGDDNSGVVVFHEVGSDQSYRSYSVCNNGVSQREANAVCAGLGFKYGALKYAGEFRSADFPSIGKSGFTCAGEATNAMQCEGQEYPGTTNFPCLEGEELAVSCYNNAWEFAVKDVSVKLWGKNGNAKGLVKCYPHAMLRGSSLDFQNDVQMFLVNVKGEGAELVKKMKLRKMSALNLHVGRIKPRDRLQHNCLACVASLRGVNSRFFAAQVEGDGCKMEKEAALKLVSEWVMKKNEEN